MYILAQSKHLVGPIPRFMPQIGGPTFTRIALTGLLVLGAAANAAAQSVQRQVLVLQSLYRGNLVLDNFTTNFRVELDQRAEQPVNLRSSLRGPNWVCGRA
jgi:hypothetical protein